MALPLSQLHEGIIVSDEFHTVQVQGLPVLLMNAGILKELFGYSVSVSPSVKWE